MAQKKQEYIAIPKKEKLTCGDVMKMIRLSDEQKGVIVDKWNTIVDNIRNNYAERKEAE